MAGAKINPKHYRVAVFGSARIKKGDPRYKMVHELAHALAQEGVDLITGGGPGLMDAASRGHHIGRKSKDLKSIGLAIHLPHEQKDGYHLDIKREHSKFSTRLDQFMRLSHAVIVAPGGIGTLLEFFYTWQLVQTNFICETPIILLGKHWKTLLKWVKKEALDQKLMNINDFDYIFCVSTVDQAMNIIRAFHKHHKSGELSCNNYTKYKDY